MSCVYHDQPEVIAAYARHELPEQEQEKFEAHYLGCEDCSRELFLIEKTRLAMNQHGAVIFARAPKSLSSLSLTETLQKIRYWFGNAAAAWLQESWPALAGYALLVITLGVGYTWLSHQEAKRATTNTADAGTSLTTSPHSTKTSALNPPAWPEELYAKLAQQSSPAEWQAARQSYIDKDYRPAAERIEQLLQKNPEAKRLQLFWSVSLLRIGDFTAASMQLEDFVAQYPQDLAATWFLSEAYLAQNSPDKAKPLLRKLSSSGDSLYVKLASNQLESLSSAQKP
ncbi:zf-HC2 domain-containing protein [bacterium]|nr:zf-HC2 domain-containing protein [bacterium]